jgi:curved DNA-binding protein CbpA
MNTYSKNEETFYDILKVGRKSTVAEIVAAYHNAKNAFSKDSIATYSLFSNEEAQSVLNKLEEAYLTLSNFEKRAEYERILSLKSQHTDVPPFSELELKQKAEMHPHTGERSTSPEPKTPIEGPAMVDALDGAILKTIREKRSLSLEDVSRITKIPVKTIKAIEGDNIAKLPARVYVQGFVINLASLYKLEPNNALKAYLVFLDLKAKPVENS